MNLLRNIGYNDNYGHIAGDNCLKLVGESILAKIQRKTDLVTRYGGDEFAIILYDTDLKQAEIVAEKIMNALKKANIKHEFSPNSERVTLSIGIGSARPSVNEGYEPLLLLADNALYQAKQNGRNTIYCAKAVEQ